jgi:hypothetical protein
VKKNIDKLKEIENVKYEVAQEMGLPQARKRTKDKDSGKKK